MSMFKTVGAANAPTTQELWLGMPTNCRVGMPVVSVPPPVDKLGAARAKALAAGMPGKPHA